MLKENNIVSTPHIYQYRLEKEECLYAECLIMFKCTILLDLQLKVACKTFMRHLIRYDHKIIVNRAHAPGVLLFSA